MIHPTDQFASYLAGGLSADERALIDEHLETCERCRSALDEARSADERMNELFAGQQPGNDFEERMIANLRRRQKLTHPLVRRIAVGVAASIVLGGIGYVGSAGIREGRLPEFSFLDGRLVEHSVQTDMQLDGVLAIAHSTLGDGSSSSAPPTTQPRIFHGHESQFAGTSTGRTAHYTSDQPKERAFLGARHPTSGTEPGGLPLIVRGGDELAFRNSDADTKKSDADARNPLRNDSGSALDFKGTPTASQTIDIEQKTQSAPITNESVLSRSLKASDSSMQTYRNGKPLSADGKGGAAKEAEARFDPAKFIEEGRKDRGSAPAAEDSRFKLDGVILKTDSATASSSSRQQSDAPRQQADSAASKRNAPAMIAAVTDDDADKQKSQTPPPESAKPEPKPAENPPAALPPREMPAPAANEAVVKPKIIRTGEMEFEVDSFDSTVNTLNKIVAEETGYISTTNSDKLPNGKVKGEIVLRVPAEHLDTLVLKLRGIGELHSQRINAQDITKQFTDIESSLRAAKAMQERLLDIIKNGKGTVKDLLEAEKQLGVWREKVEQLEGEIRYYSNQVAYSTLTVTLLERDLRAPASASETETVTMALETDKVDDAYTKAKEAITSGKGRMISSELKQIDAGQLGATLIAQVPPDAADGVIGRLKQLEGRIARFERQRAQTTSNGNAPVDPRIPGEAVKVKREDVTINLTLYNLENVAPRRTTTLTLVAADVEQTYHALIEQVRSANGRVVTSQVNRIKADQIAGTINFQVPTEKAEVVLAALRSSGEVLKTETSESADMQNVTESKRGFVVTIGSLPAFGARETQQVQLAALKVPDAFEDLLNLIRSDKGRIIQSRLNEQDRGNTNATLEFEIGRDMFATIDSAMLKDGQIVTRQVNRSVDTDNTVDSKVHIALSISSSEQLPPRQNTDLSVEVSDVQKAMEDLLASALTAGGRQIDNPTISQGDNGQTFATLTLDAPLDRVQSLIESADTMGARKLRRTTIDSHSPEGKLARARLTVTFATPATLASSEDGVWAGVRRGLGTSLRGLSYSLTLIVVGLCLVAPWVILIGGVWRGWKWARRNNKTTV